MHEYLPDTVFPRAAGVLLHPTSLPSSFGIGDLGEGAFRFMSFLARAGFSWWQVLPLVPAGPGDSPYSSPSSMAGNPMLVDLVMLQRAGLLAEADIEVEPGFDVDRVDYRRVHQLKGERLRMAARKLLELPGHAFTGGLAAFRAAEPWVEDFALFTALKEHNQHRPWWEWEPGLRDRDPAALDEARKSLAPHVERIVVEQYFFDMQWKMLRVQGADLTIRTIGDLPIYVDRDSVDMWCHRQLFLVDEQGSPTDIAGVPPDPFSDIGQLWGNPLYDWDRHREEGYAFWIARLKRALTLYDAVRIDHFRGFSRFWAVPADAEDARAGRWEPGPGAELFDVLQRELAPKTGQLPIIAEDLGVIDQPVRDLLAHAGLPGMKITQFAFGEDGLNPYLPHNHVEACVVYTGTHDTQTLRGAWESYPPHVKDHIRRYFGVSDDEAVFALTRSALASVAHTAIFPLQDLLALDDGARMNVPGQAEGNWVWRVRAEAFHDEFADQLNDLLTLYNRDELKRLQLETARRAREAKDA